MMGSAPARAQVAPAAEEAPRPQVEELSRLNRGFLARVNAKKRVYLTGTTLEGGFDEPVLGQELLHVVSFAFAPDE